jgi:hypothetical protein
MADLSIGISVDTAKAKADLKLFNAEIANTTKAMAAANKAGDTAGQAAEHQKLVGLYQQQAKALATVTAAKKQDTAATRAHTASLRESGLELGHLAHAAGLPIEGLRALRLGFAAFAGVELIRGLTAASNKISDLIELSRQARFDPSTIQAFSLALERAGGKAEDAKTAITGFGEAFLNQQKQAIEIGDRARLAYAQAIAGGEGAGAGLQAATKVFSDATLASSNTSLEKLGITAGRFAATTQGMRQALAAASQALVRLNASSELEADILSRDVFKKPYADLAPALEAAARGSVTLLESQLGLAKLTAEQIAANKEYQKTVNELTAAWDAFSKNLFTAVGPSITWLIDKLSLAAQLIKELIDLADPNSIRNVEVPRPIADRIAAAGITPRPAGSVSGQASGGYIRGPGSGTSDSILARLSNGEFVVNAASTRRLGTSFLNGLNSFAAGGLVNVPPIRFASGGLVAAGGGNAMASFHFESGSSFKLGGPVDVVNAMVTEAHAQQVRSAGVKPSWYAARPSGR